MKQYRELLIRARATITALEAQATCELQHGMTEEQEKEFRNAVSEKLELIRQMDAMKLEANTRDLKLLYLWSRLEDAEELKTKYESQIKELQRQLMVYRRNESCLFERPRGDESWKTQCDELEQDLVASREVGLLELLGLLL